jgi:hypothetical protein
VPKAASGVANLSVSFGAFCGFLTSGAK